jgi:hypothetical protein
MALALWNPLNNAASATLRLSMCARCHTLWTEVAATRTACPTCAAIVAIPADPT